MVYISLHSVCIFSAPGGDFSLDAGVSSVLQQLEAVCRESQQFRALNLDISCPAHLPHLTSCACVVKSRAGEVVRRENGTAGYNVRVPVIVICDICNNVVPGMWMWEVPPAELRLAARHHQVTTTHPCPQGRYTQSFRFKLVVSYKSCMRPRLTQIQGDSNLFTDFFLR